MMIYPGIELEKPKAKSKTFGKMKLNNRKAFNFKKNKIRRKMAKRSRRINRGKR